MEIRPKPHVKKKKIQLCPDCAQTVLCHHSFPLLHQIKCQFSSLSHVAFDPLTLRQDFLFIYLIGCNALAHSSTHRQNYSTSCAAHQVVIALYLPSFLPCFFFFLKLFIFAKLNSSLDNQSKTLLRRLPRRLHAPSRK